MKEVAALSRKGYVKPGPVGRVVGGESEVDFEVQLAAVERQRKTALGQSAEDNLAMLSVGDMVVL